MGYGYKRKYSSGRGSVLFSTIRENERLRKSAQRQRSAKKAMRDQFSKANPRGSEQSKTIYGTDWKTATPEQRVLRRGVGFVGAGDYKDVLKYASRGIGAAAGGALGYMGGGLAGGGAGLSSGWGQGAAFSKFMGWGDYGPTSGNQIITGMGDQQQISVNQSSATGDIIIEHTEFVQNITASVTSAPSSSLFQITALPINPGLQGSFPFLAQLAQNFELYEFHGLIFQYKPTSGEYGNNSSNSIGKVAMATNYDPGAANFANSIVLENYDYANSAKPSVGIIHGVETAQSQRYSTQLYVRTGQTARDRIFTDLGTFQIATEGIPFGGAGAQTAIVGELWVTYKIKLSRAQLFQSYLGQSCAQDFITGSGTSAAYATAVGYKSTNTIGCVLSNVGVFSCKLTFPVNIALGYYQVIVYETYSPAAGSAGVTIGGAINSTVFQLTFQLPGSATNGVSNFAPTSGTTTNSANLCICGVAIEAPGLQQASVVITTTVSTATRSFYIYVLQTDARAAKVLN